MKLNLQILSKLKNREKTTGILLVSIVLCSVVGAIATVSAAPQLRGARWSLDLYTSNYQPGDKTFTIYGHLKYEEGPFYEARIYLQYWDGSKWQTTSITPKSTDRDGYYSFLINIPGGGLASLRTYASVGTIREPVAYSNVLGINVSTPGLH